MRDSIRFERRQTCTVWFRDQCCGGEVCLIADVNSHEPFWSGRVEMEAARDPRSFLDQSVWIEFADGRSGEVQVAYDLFSDAVQDFHFYGPLRADPARPKILPRTGAEIGRA